MFNKYFLFFLLLCGAGECGELVLFLTCDTEANNLEESVYKDLQNVRDEALRISHFTGMPIREISFQGYELNAEFVLNSLNSLNIEHDDVLIYYFSGHGYRTPSKNDDPWPYLFFSKSGFGVDYDRIIEILSKKHPRLLITIADCCNNVMEERYAPPVYRHMGSRKKNEKIADAYWKLFMETEGKILITSSDIGEYSWCIPKGALFTLALIEGIKTEAEKGTANWERILERASLKVKQYQSPFYIITRD